MTVLEVVHRQEFSQPLIEWCARASHVLSPGERALLAEFADAWPLLDRAQTAQLLCLALKLVGEPRSSASADDVEQELVRENISSALRIVGDLVARTQEAAR